jgi:hypothetical protein
MELAALAPDDDQPEPEIDDEPMVTRTMAELFASQGLLEPALEVFRQLLEATPGDAGLRQRIAEIAARLEGGDRRAAAPAAPPDDVDRLPVSAGTAGEEDDLSGHAWDPGAQTDPHDVDTPFAWTQNEPDDASPAGPPIGRYFTRLLGWEPGGGATPRDGGDDPTNRPNRDDT